MKVLRRVILLFLSALLPAAAISCEKPNQPVVQNGSASPASETSKKNCSKRAGFAMIDGREGPEVYQGFGGAVVRLGYTVAPKSRPIFA